MAVRIRLKKMGRRHRPFFRVCAMDSHNPRGGKVLEELGTYDPMLADTDARAVLITERIDYWLGVGAQPTEKVGVLIKKYGTNGSHLEKQKAALEVLAQPKVIPEPGKPASMPKPPEPKVDPAAEKKAAEKKATEKKAAKSKDADAPAPEAAAPAAATPEAAATEPKADDAKSDTAEVATEAPAADAAPAEPAAVEPAAEAASDDAAEGEAKKES